MKPPPPLSAASEVTQSFGEGSQMDWRRRRRARALECVASAEVTADESSSCGVARREAEIEVRSRWSVASEGSSRSEAHCAESSESTCESFSCASSSLANQSATAPFNVPIATSVSGTTLSGCLAQASFTALSNKASRAEEAHGGCEPRSAASISESVRTIAPSSSRHLSTRSLAPCEASTRGCSTSHAVN